MGIGRATVETAVTSYTRGPGFECSHEWAKEKVICPGWVKAEDLVQANLLSKLKNKNVTMSNAG